MNLKIVILCLVSNLLLIQSHTCGNEGDDLEQKWEEYKVSYTYFHFNFEAFNSQLKTNWELF